jgi:hypothetical protein
MDKKKNIFFSKNWLKPTTLFDPETDPSAARVSSISSISSRGDGLDPNLLYPTLEEEGPPLFSQLLQK